jgi:polyhydroxyalkanoate synthesis repressor PhaR
MRELKKYPNRRLYDLTDSHYITAEDVGKMIIDGESIHVVDSKDGSNITRSVLLQILTEQEAEGHEPVLTDRAIEQIIRFYGKNFGGVVSRYIEQSILTFLEHQDQFQRRMREMSDLLPRTNSLGQIATREREGSPRAPQLAYRPGRGSPSPENSGPGS